jgi:hypothetical protein
MSTLVMSGDDALHATITVDLPHNQFREEFHSRKELADWAEMQSQHLEGLVVTLRNARGKHQLPESYFQSNPTRDFSDLESLAKAPQTSEQA